jgi:hypothetical protein
VLKLVESRIRALAERHDLLENFLLVGCQRLELPAMVVQHAYGAGEAQLERAPGHGQRIDGIFHAAPKHRVDVHLKLSVFRQQHQLLVQHLEAFLRDLIRHGVVDADLQVKQAGAVQAADAIGREQVAIGNHPGDGAGFCAPER